jgi:hypothetical protein
MPLPGPLPASHPKNIEILGIRYLYNIFGKKTKIKLYIVKK